MSKRHPRNRIGKIYEITTLGPATTGLKYTLMAGIVSERLNGSYDRFLNFPPRIELLVCTGRIFALTLHKPFVVVTNKKIAAHVDENDLNKIRKFIQINQQVLVDHFNAVIPSSEELINTLQSIEAEY